MQRYTSRGCELRLSRITLQIRNCNNATNDTTNIHNSTQVNRRNSAITLGARCCTCVDILTMILYSSQYFSHSIQLIQASSSVKLMHLSDLTQTVVGSLEFNVLFSTNTAISETKSQAWRAIVLPSEGRLAIY